MAINIDKKLLKDKNASGGSGAFIKSLKDVQLPKWTPLALALIVVVIIAAIFFLGRINRSVPVDGAPQGTTFADQIDPNAFEVEVLPKTVRSFNGDDSVNPFATAGNAAIGDIKITGIIINSNGRATAIIQTAGASYITSLGDKLPESDWVVSSIQKNSITFSLEGEEKTIYMES